MIRAVLFDLYETLVTEFDPHWEPQATPAERLGVGDAAFAAAWREEKDLGVLGMREDYREILSRICRRLQVAPDLDVLETLIAERAALKAEPFARIHPEIIAILDALRDLGVGIAVVTNAVRDEVAPLAGSALQSRIDTCVVSADLGVAKPDAAIYRSACARLGVQPHEALFVGDGGHDELAGAERAGLEPRWASWFIDRWPAWRGVPPGAELAT